MNYSLTYSLTRVKSRDASASKKTVLGDHSGLFSMGSTLSRTKAFRSTEHLLLVQEDSVKVFDLSRSKSKYAGC